MPADLVALERSLAVETEWLLGVLGALADEQWDLPTPASGWAVRDQVSHLAYFDDAVVRAVRDPDAFKAERDAAFADVDAFTESIARRNRALTPAELLAWLRSSRATMLDVLRAAGPSARMPWYGPSMSVASALTARVMETWAHGQDVADAVGAVHPASVALHDIAELGVRTFGFAFGVRALDVPETPPTVELIGPNGEHWVWPGSADRVEGPAAGFVALVTQRRHLDDTGVVATGPVAETWLGIAQCFAGPPGTGRARIH